MQTPDDPTAESPLARVRRACLALPGVTESVAWGDPLFLAAGRPFAGVGPVVPWGLSLRLRVGTARQSALLRDPRFFPSPRLLHRGWVSLKLADVDDWTMVDALLRATYDAVARGGAIDPKAGRSRPGSGLAG